MSSSRWPTRASRASRSTPRPVTTNLGNGNSISGTATVTRTNGTTTAVDALSVSGGDSAGNLNLADNPFYREFIDTVQSAASPSRSAATSST